MMNKSRWRMKKMIGLFVILLLLSGCNTKAEDEKREYIAFKNKMLTTRKYQDNIPIELIADIKRKDEQTVSYQVTLQNPKENMHNIKIMVINDYSSEELFPTVGLFDQEKELLASKDTSNKIELTGEIETTKNISQLNLNLKVGLEYKDDQGNSKEYYYHF